MFTLEQISAAHAKVKTGADFPRYVQELKTLGLARYDFMLEDGHAVYFGQGEYQIASPPKYALQSIADQTDAQALKRHISEHQQGKTDFPTICKLFPSVGVEKWTTDIQNMEVVYYDKAGNKLLVEPIPQAGY